MPFLVAIEARLPNRGKLLLLFIAARCDNVGARGGLSLSVNLSLNDACTDIVMHDDSMYL